MFLKRQPGKYIRILKEKKRKMRRAARVDKNQAEIVKTFRQMGAIVIITSQLKNAFDLLVCYKGKTHIVEVKDGDEVPSKRKLTDGEIKCKIAVESVGVKYNIIKSVDEAIKFLGQV